PEVFEDPAPAVPANAEPVPEGFLSPPAPPTPIVPAAPDAGAPTAAQPIAQAPAATGAGTPAAAVPVGRGPVKMAATELAVLGVLALVVVVPLGMGLWWMTSSRRAADEDGTSA
ncbi:MAG: hypothetical protein JNK53_09180, partial [Phycisphaerae bacterium]|nr:hypothetical protein [Phycisphaerae bacterium]